MTPANSGQAGFSLLEVLAAFAILAVSLGVILPVFRDTAQSAAITETRRAALHLARNQLQRAGTEWPLRPGSHEGDQNGLRWRVTITPEGEQPESPFIAYRVESRVAGAGRVIAFSTLRLGPRTGENRP